MKQSSPVLLWGPAILYAALIFVLSSFSKVPTGPENSDKVFHFFEYFLFAALLWRALRRPHFQHHRIQKVLLVFCIGGLYAASDEIHQMFVPGRTSSIYDWMADVAGITGMLTLMLIAVKWRGTAFNYDSI